jgi:hypothetical protein
MGFFDLFKGTGGTIGGGGKGAGIAGAASRAAGGMDGPGTGGLAGNLGRAPVPFSNPPRGKGDTSADWAKVGERLRPRYEQSYQEGKIPGSPGYETSVKQNPNIDPQTGKPWRAVSLLGAGGALGGFAEPGIRLPGGGVTGGMGQPDLATPPGITQPELQMPGGFQQPGSLGQPGGFQAPGSLQQPGLMQRLLQQFQAQQPKGLQKKGLQRKTSLASPRGFSRGGRR